MARLPRQSQVRSRYFLACPSSPARRHPPAPPTPTGCSSGCPGTPCLSVAVADEIRFACLCATLVVLRQSLTVAPRNLNAYSEDSGSHRFGGRKDARDCAGCRSGCVARFRAVIASIDLYVVLARFRDSFDAGIEVTQVDSVLNFRQPRASVFVNLVVPVRLRVLVYVVVQHSLIASHNGMSLGARV